MKILNMLLISLLGMSLSACSSSSELYQIPLVDFSTEVYDELQYQLDEGYFEMTINNDFVSEISINKISISIPEEYNVLDNTNVSFNFEVNGYQLCDEDLRLYYSDLSGFTSVRKSCNFSLQDLEVSKDEFVSDTIDIYIIFNYTNMEEQAIYSKNLYSIITGNLVEYRK